MSKFKDNEIRENKINLVLLFLDENRKLKRNTIVTISKDNKSLVGMYYIDDKEKKNQICECDMRLADSIIYKHNRKVGKRMMQI